MTIKSDNPSLTHNNDLDITTVKAWWKYCHWKGMAVVSLGAFWDFRNDKPEKKYIKFVDEMIEDYYSDMSLLTADAHYLYKGKKDNGVGRFWIENKYYGWKFEHVSNGKMPLTIKQIAKVDKLLQMVIEKDID